MKKIFTIHLCTVFFLSISAQKEAVHNSSAFNDIKEIVHAVGQEAWVDMENQILREVGLPGIFTLKSEKIISSLAFTHYHYNIHVNGVPVLGGKLHALVTKEGILKRISYNSLPFQLAESQSFPQPQAENLKDAYEAETILSDEKIYLPQGNLLIPARRLELSAEGRLHKEIIYTGQEVLFEIDQIKRHHFAGPNDTIAYGYVFEPDPLTSAQTNYNFPYIDSNDQDVAELNAERKNKLLLMTYENGVFIPKNDFVEIVDVSAPFIAPVTRTDDQFLYGRSEAGFEDINVLYHITNHKQHMDALGFSSLPGYTILADPHAKNNDDNSEFQTNSFPYKLLFGEGGVDDAEDADVIIHEYTHAYVLAASNNNNGSSERNTIEEALGDYFAASYSRTVNSFQKGKVFNWDGHNEFWSGRMAESQKDYRQTIFNPDIYRHTDLFVSPLMEIYDHLGRDVTDQIVMEAIFSMGQTTTMPQMAEYIYEADSAINGGVNYNTIVSAFIRRNILDSSYLSAKHYSSKGKEGIKIYGTFEFARGGELTLETENEAIKSYILYDLSGKPLETRYLPPRSNKISLSASNLSAGLYLIEVTLDNGMRSVHKVQRY